MLNKEKSFYMVVLYPVHTVVCNKIYVCNYVARVLKYHLFVLSVHSNDLKEKLKKWDLKNLVMS